MNSVKSAMRAVPDSGGLVRRGAGATDMPGGEGGEETKRQGVGVAKGLLLLLTAGSSPSQSAAL